MFQEFNRSGDLPAAVHRASLDQVIQQFGSASPRRIVLGERMRRVYRLAAETRHLARFIVFGSFITSHPPPNDVDVFLVMDDEFDVSHVMGEAAVLFSHTEAQAYFGASVFWLRRRAALGGEQAAVEHWQIKRDGRRRGIVEVTTV